MQECDHCHQGISGGKRWRVHEWTLCTRCMSRHIVAHRCD